MNFESQLFTLAMLAYLISFFAHSIAVSLDRKPLYAAGRIGAIVGALTATIGLALRWHASGHPPLSNMYESLVTLSTFLAWSTILFTWKMPLSLVEAGSAVLAILMIGIASVFSRETRPLIPALQSYWLHLHVSVAFVGEACFALSFVLSYLYCLRRMLEGYTSSPRQDAPPPASGLEKTAWAGIVFGMPILFLAGMVGLAVRIARSDQGSGQWQAIAVWVIAPMAFCLVILLLIGYLFRGAVGKTAEKWLPEAQILDELTYRAIALGYPLFTVGAIIFGMVWANKAWGRYWGWDPKETWALITFLVYSMYLHVRLTRGWQGTWTALLSILGFLFTMFTLFGVNLLLAGLHSYGSN